jgi:hypothetical protein
MAEAARPARVEGRVGTGVLNSRIAPAVRHELDSAAVVVREQQRPVFGFFELDAGASQMGARGLRGAGRGELEGNVVEARLGRLDQLEAIRLVVAGERGSLCVSVALCKPELQRPPL